MSYQVLIKPVETDKSRTARLDNVIVFEVDKRASKTQIKQAFEQYYGQTPTSIRTAMTRAKFKFGAKYKKIQKSPDTKKAYIEVKKPIDNFAKIK